jgi:GcrA cell cycle regulator
MQGFWTDERREIAEKLAGEGKSAAMIAREIGCTRNAVVGLAFRNREKMRLTGDRNDTRLLQPGCGGKGWADKALKIRKALDAGVETHEKIAESFGVSLAIVSKMSRAMGPKRQASQRQKDDARIKARIRVRLMRKDEPGAPPVRGFDPAGFRPGYLGQQGRVALVDLKPSHCRFPIDMPADESGKVEVRYCGETKEDGSSYCSAHAARCFTGPVKTTPRQGQGFPLRHVQAGGWV